MKEEHASVPAWAAKNSLVALIYRALRMLKNEGLLQVLKGVRHYVHRKRYLNRMKKQFYLNPQQRAQQEKTIFARMPKISLITPVYNPPLSIFEDLLRAVAAQSYGNWQLCLADGSDAGHPEAEALCTEWAARDPRIVYQKLDKNLGIAGNTNAAIALSDGDFIALLDQDDLITEAALFEVVRAINNTGAEFLYTDEAIFTKTPYDSHVMHFKPDYSPDFLRGCNYICHFSVIARPLLETVGGYNPDYDGSQDYDFTLRITETTKNICHIPKPLYYWRSHPGSVADDISYKPYAYDAAVRAVQSHLDRMRFGGTALYATVAPMVRVVYEIPGTPLVSIIIPTCDQHEVLKRCVESILEKSSYPNYEIILCENNSKDPVTFAYYETLAAEPRVRVAVWDKPFNFSAINNFGRSFAGGQQLIFLNNDIEIISPDWIEEMVMFTQRDDVGAAGIKLLYPDNSVQHGGIAVGIGGSAANLCPLYPRNHEGYLFRLTIASNMSAVTGACLCVRTAVFDEVGGWNEALAVAFNDVDLCLKIREKGYLVVYNPVAEAYHYESISRGSDRTGEKKARMEKEIAILRARWPQYYGDGHDPYYNPNFGRTNVSYDV